MNTRLGKKEFISTPYPFRVKMGTVGYPVYIRVTFKRKTTQIRSHIPNNYTNLDGLSKNDRILLEKDCQTILDIVIYLDNLITGRSRNQENNVITNFKAYFKYYSKPLNDLIRNGLEEVFLNTINRCDSEYTKMIDDHSFYVTPFSTLLNASKAIIPDFEDKSEPEEKRLFEIFAKLSIFSSNDSDTIIDLSFSIINWISANKRDIIQEIFPSKISEADANFLINYIDSWVLAYDRYIF